MKIAYDIEARRQIGEIFRYGKKKFGTSTALKYKEAIRHTILHLKQHPFMGSIEGNLSDTKHEYRYLLVKPYKIIYSVKDETVRIHFFWHTSQDPDTLPQNIREE